MNNMLFFLKRLSNLLIPDSLIKRISITLMVSIIILFLINISIITVLQDRVRGFLEKEHFDNIASFYVLLSEMNNTQRIKAIDRIDNFTHLSRGSLFLNIIHEPPTWAENLPPQMTQVEQAIATLKSILIINNKSFLPEIRARIFKYNDDYNIDAWSRQINITADRNNLILQIGIQLDSNTWLDVVQPLFQKVGWLIRMERSVFFIEFVIFAILVLFMLRKLLTPLQILSQAADHIGKNPEVVAPLSELGCKEIREAAQSFNRMQARIKTNIDERNRMLAAMSHDLRTPLTRMQLRIEELENEYLRERLIEGIKEIKDITEQSFELSKSLKSSEKAVPLDIYSFIQSSVDNFTEIGNTINIIDIVENIAVIAKPMCLKRCIDNILNNAIIYAGSADIKIRVLENDVYIDIYDNGPGVPEEFLEKIIEPYFRLESSRNRDSGGIGLGLSIARNMALLNNGDLIISNRPEGGLLVRITLPRLIR